MHKLNPLPLLILALGVAAPLHIAAHAQTANRVPASKPAEKTTPAAKASVKDGVEAWSAGDYATAIRDWQPLAAAGDPDAEFNLAQAYKMGRGVPQDLDRAETLYGAAAAQGHVQAADTYGLLLFQNGQREKALPFIEASARRGDPRAWYILGVAHFNGDLVPKDWVRAYALTSLAQQAGLPQAARALKQMDQFIPLAQRQQSVPLASQIAARAQQIRAQQQTSASLGNAIPGDDTLGTTPPAVVAAASSPVAGATRDGPASAGADFARPRIATAQPEARPGPQRAPDAPRPVLHTEAAQNHTAPAPPPAPAPVRPAARTPEPAASRPEARAHGPWRVQFGAFAVSSNVDALWKRLARRPELAGHPRIESRAGRLTKLQAGGFASEAEASAACTRLKAKGFTCVPVRD